jgi:hypothetical protein
MGSDAFREKLLQQLDTRLPDKATESYTGGAKRAHGEREAERLVKKTLEALGVRDKDLEGRKKSDPVKCVLAWLVRTHTSVAADWVSARLFMGHRSAVSNAVRRVADGRDPQTRRLQEVAKSII